MAVHSRGGEARGEGRGSGGGSGAASGAAAGGTSHGAAGRGLGGTSRGAPGGAAGGAASGTSGGASGRASGGASGHAHDDVGGEFLELVYGLMRDLRRESADAPGLTTPGQLRLLRALRQAGEPRRPGELAVTLDVAPRSVTAKVDQAEADGLVRRLPDPRDRRATLVELTDAGSAALAASSSARHEGAAARLARLTPDERAELVRLLRVVTRGPSD